MTHILYDEFFFCKNRHSVAIHGNLQSEHMNIKFSDKIWRILSITEDNEILTILLIHQY